MDSIEKKDNNPAKPLHDMPWVIFRLMQGQFAVSANHVREMVAMPKVVSVPKTPDYIRGMMNLRGKVFPVIDLRLRLGMASSTSETDVLIELLNQREQDHKNWIAELEASVRECRGFKLATNPHKCAFGKWYDNFITDNRILATCLEQFDEPHKKIHAIAVKVKELEGQKEFDAAYEIINQTKERELARMIELFAEVRDLLKHSNREIALVLESKEKAMIVSVDSVASVERIVESDIEDMPEETLTTDNEFITGIGKCGKDKDFVQLLNVDSLIGLQNGMIHQASLQQ